MVPNYWYVILESDEVPRRAPVGVVRFGQRWVLWRRPDGAVACVQDQCAHRGAALSGGRVVDGHVECPFHGFRFDETGQCVMVPALGREARVPDHIRGRALPICEVDGYLWAWWGPDPAGPAPAHFFETLDSSWRYGAFRDPWAVHYTRSVENQLDVVHLPFVHGTTIGRGNKTVVEGPRAELDGDDLKVWVHNRVDDGSAPTDPPASGRWQVMFRFPNTWINDISDKVKVTAAFVPVDDEHSVVYLRFYQRVLTVPGISALFCWVGKLASVVILRQDKRVVETQEPRRSWLRMGEHLIRGDLPVILYRKRRHALLGGADEG
ncbi:MAG: aromatic ring-hydroxylating dioxygenase subunit alpha [Deltaproteobacteria bacterium]|nr:aromatic ring-hydroxylating dioxygenase subunit alpha [Deltaproteobacteria bacterium]